MNALEPEIFQVASPFAGLVFLLDVALKGTLLALSALAVARLLRRRLSAATQHSLLFFSLCAVLILPLISEALPQWRIPLFPEIVGNSPELTLNVAAQTLPERDNPARQNQYTSDLRKAAIGSPDSASETESDYQDLSAAEDSAEGAVSPATATPLASARETVRFYDPLGEFTRELSARDEGGQRSLLGNPHWSFWIFAAWFTGMFVVLLRLLVGSIESYLIMAAADKKPEPEWLDLLERTSGRLGISRRVILMFSGRLALPKSGGILWPVVVLPEKAKKWDAERRELVLLHELAHIKRWDILTLIVGRLACAFNWINPLIWYTHIRMRNEMERACDDLVLAGGMKPSEYAIHLTELAHSFQFARSSWVSAAMAHRSSLKDRLLSILDLEAKRTPSSGNRTTVIAGLVFVVLLPLAAFHPWSAADNPSLEGILNPDPPTKETEIEDLALQDLTNALANGDEEMRQQSAVLLGRLGDERAVDSLICALDDQSAAVRQYAAWALGRLGSDCADVALTAALDDPDEKVRKQALWALGRIESSAAADIYRTALSNDEPFIRMQAAHALAGQEGEQSVSALIKVLDDIDADVRLQAVYTLRRIGGESVVPGLVKALSDVDSDVRAAAVRALAEINSPAVIPGLTVALSDENSSIRREAIRSLDDLDDSGKVDSLIHSATTDQNTENRVAALRALRRLRTNRAFPAFASALYSDANAVRREAIPALCELDHPKVLDLLEAALMESYYRFNIDDDSRILMIRAIGRFGNRKSAEALRYVIDKTGSNRVRRIASEELRKLR